MEAGARGPGQEPRRPGRLCRSVGEKGSAGPGQAGLGGASARPKRFSSTAPPFASVGPGATHPPSARTSSTPKAAGEDAGRLALRRHRTQRRVARRGCLAPAAHRAGRHQPEGRHVPGPAPSTARSPVTGLREEPESRRRRGTRHCGGVPGPVCSSSGKQSRQGTEPSARARSPAPRPAPVSPGGGVTAGGRGPSLLPYPPPGPAPAARPARLTWGRLWDRRDAPTPLRVTAGLRRDWHSRPGPPTSRARGPRSRPHGRCHLRSGGQDGGAGGRGTGEGQKREAGDTRMASPRGVLVQKEAREGKDGARKGESGSGSEDAEPGASGCAFAWVTVAARAGAEPE